MATTLLLLIFLLLLLLLLSPLTFSLPTPTPTPTPSPTPLVRSTCNATTYYDLCVASLSADPAAAAARDPAALSSILVSRAASDAANASAAAASLATAVAAAADPAPAAALRACAAKYAAARDALGRARAALAAAEYDYAFVHVGAAAEYPRACRALFRRQAPRLTFPAEIARREDALERLCTDALDIITLLGD